MSGERTEKPTPRRRKELRRDNVGIRSPEAASAVGLVVLAAVAPKLIGSMATALLSLMRDAFTRAATLGPQEAAGFAVHSLVSALKLMAPSVGLVVGASFLTHVAISRGRANPYALKPHVKSLNPAKSIKNLLGTRSLIETGKGTAKLTAVAVLMWIALPSYIDQLMSGPGSLEDFLTVVAAGARSLLTRALLVAVIVGAFDLWWNTRKFNKQARMTIADVRRESKDSDGDPMLKSMRRQRAAQLARNRMMKDVATATVVVTNPTHIAIALRYGPGDIAPVIVARGAGLLAARIRTLAAEANVPVQENKPLARSLYRTCRVGDLVPVEFYEAVAVVLAAIMRASRKAGQR